VSPEETLAAIRRAQVIAVVRAADADAALKAADELVQDGIRAIELTFTTPGVERALIELAERHPEVVVGAGTITRPEQAVSAAEAGASFLVSPVALLHLVDAMKDTGLAAIPGCLTPTEILMALDAGAHAVKIFPAGQLGPGYVKALRGPFPGARLIPTGGIDPADVDRWLEAGAFAVGIGGRLTPARAEPERG
jgi:2-dehydro-3-deoxyphosphogluconate aldolase/(4S)-4-hydroxy-2-oxoglutarate aldolase